MQLKMKYPCAKLKGIEWEAVGRELLPRAAKGPMRCRRGGSRVSGEDEFYHPVREAAGGRSRQSRKARRADG